MTNENRNKADLRVGDIELPDPREVNRRIKQEAKLAKAREAVSRRNQGAWAHLLEGACAQKRAHDVKAQLNYLYAHGVLMAGIGRVREVGHETRSKHSETMENLFDDLSKLGMKLKDVRHFSRKHVVAAIRYWINKSQAPATLQTKVSVVRRFLTLIGKPEAMPRGAVWTQILREAGLEPVHFKRTYVAEVSKSWIDAGVDPLLKIEEVWADSPVCGAALLLQLIGGLRVNESLSDSPMTMDCEDFLRLEKGTKGRRRRDLRLAVTEEEFERARAALERVKKVASGLPRRILGLPGKNLEQMRQHFYYVMRKHGITMNEGGIVPHGLRHGFLHARYEASAELPAPVLRLAPPLAYAENAAAVKVAKKRTSEDAGHSRDASHYYLGNEIAMTKAAKGAEQAMLAAIGQSLDIAKAFDQAGVQTAWLVGRIAYGVKLGREHALEVQVLLQPSARPELIGELQQAMERVLGLRVNVIVSYDPLRRPEVGTEVILARG
ncbi:phage integrase N-terminal domain-containing protein [Ramlibacter sp. WS9]|uniref:phage integrase N-terminal domain-containing protein n=1 Tax=Ramlibacter sp. WS9 TaxID=1882741 RepID=UPI001142B028|nr:phage integrase N-terminal domain-containing protein [Ramlibacter sp. WS9]ROZ74947.1 hypothetical protein EEB15_16320 [Ramlibacter sp. WS9]